MKRKSRVSGAYPTLTFVQTAQEPAAPILLNWFHRGSGAVDPRANFVHPVELQAPLRNRRELPPPNSVRGPQAEASAQILALEDAPVRSDVEARRISQEHPDAASLCQPVQVAPGGRRCAGVGQLLVPFRGGKRMAGHQAQL